MKRSVTEIIIHCSATPEGRAVTVADIDSWHRQRGFKSIGYHYVVTLDGCVHQGRSENEIGAHCKGHNRHSIGICYVGGLEAGTMRPKDTRTERQRRALTDLVASLRARYPAAKVHSHSDFAAKACPCFDATAEYA